MTAAPEYRQPSTAPKNLARFKIADPAHILAQGFGSGLSPIMPGTAGTLFAWASFAALTALWPQFFTPLHWAIVILAGFAIGIWACERTGRDMGISDHGSMVWDEIIAFWLVLLLLTPAPFSTQCWAFLWFRFFDMVKPPPIRHFDRHMKGGLGVMWDDIIAAFYTLLLFALWRVA
jgi:phosphatidylglycerophosphatase A